MQWNEMEHGKEYEVTIRGKALTWKFGEEDHKAVSLYIPGKVEVLVGYRELKDPNITIEIKEVP